MLENTNFNEFFSAIVNLMCTPLHYNYLDNKVATARYLDHQSVNCRRCGAQLETLGHIFGLWAHTKNRKIRLHDMIRYMMTEEMVTKDPGVVLIKEQIFSLPTTTVSDPI